MILSDGTDTRDEVAHGHGKYSDGMAVVLDALAGISGEDEFAGDFTTVGCVYRFGRRLLWVSSTGFLTTDTYPTVLEAQTVFNVWANEHDTDDEI